MRKILSNNKGISLVEVIVAIPLITILLSGIFNVISTAIASYQFSSGRMAMQQTARFAVDSMVREVQPDRNDTTTNTVTLQSAKKMEIVKTTTDGTQETVTYYLDTSTKKLMRNNEPITGDDLAGIDIDDVVFTPATNSTPTYPINAEVVSIKLTAKATNCRNNPTCIIQTTVAAL